MAQRTLTVQLRAAVQGYTASMAAAAKAGSPVEKSLSRVERAGRGMSRVGDTLTTRVTLPLAAVGAAAAKMAIDFDSTFSKMVGIAGVAADEIDGMKESVLALAGETGRAPQELAEALFFIRSAGLEGQTAMDALEVSAKAAAAGLGSTVDVADAITSAINAYGADALGAAEATDVLTAAVTAAKVPAAEMAPQFGRLLPVAAELEIQFSDVAAGLAFLTRSSGDASQAATGMAGVLNKLLKPSQAGAEALEAVGLSADKIRESIQEKGLLGTLEMLRGQMSEQQFQQLFEDAEALNGALQLTGTQADQARGVFDDLANSSGALDEAFAATDNDARKLQQAWALVQGSLIELGAILAPVVADIASFGATVMNAFQGLPGSVKESAVWVGVFVAALGPMLSIGGRLVTMFARVGRAFVVTGRALQAFAVPAGTVSGAFNTVETSAKGATRASLRSRLGFSGMATAAGAATVILGGLALAWQDHQRKQAEAEAGQRLMTDALKETNGALEGQAEELLRQSLVQSGVADTLNDLEVSYDDFVAALQGGDDEWEAFTERVAGAARAAGASQQEIGILEGQLGSFRSQMQASVSDLETEEELIEGTGTAADEATGPMGEYADETANVAGETENATSALEDYLDTLRASIDPVFAAMDAIDGVGEAERRVTEAQRERNEALVALQEAQAEHGAQSDEVAEAQRRLDDATRGVTDAERGHLDSLVDQEFALLELQAAVEGGEVSLRDAKDMIDRFRESGDITAGQARMWRRRLDDTASAADGVARPRDMDIDGPTNLVQIREGLGSIESAADSAARDRTLTITAILRQGGGFGAIPGSGRFTYGFHEGGIVPGGRSQEVPALLLGQEEVLSHDDPRHSANLARMASARPASPAAVAAGSGAVDVRMIVVGSGALAEQIHHGVRTGTIQLRAGRERVKA